MKISVGRNHNWEAPPLTPEELERAAGEELNECVEFFKTNIVQFGPQGLYMLVNGHVHLITVDLKFERTLAVDEMVPVVFIPEFGDES